MMKIVCFGDSNTYGFDPRLGSPGRLAKNERWTGILDSLPDIDIENEGLNGRCIPAADYAYRSLRRMLRKYADSDMLIIMLGTNDLFMTPNVTAQKLADRMRQVFENVPELVKYAGNPDKRVLLICPPSPSDKVLFYEMSGYPQKQSDSEAARVMRELPGEMRKVAEEYGTEFADATEWNIEYMFDGLHFSERGHRMFARKILQLVQG